MWAAILQPEDNESDLEKFADAPEADADQQGPTADGKAATAQDEPSPEAAGTAGQHQPGLANGIPAEEQWPAEGAYDMNKRCASSTALGSGRLIKRKTHP